MSIAIERRILDLLAANSDLTSAELGEAVGLSRVSARRYLEHFVDRGLATVRLNYGNAGRPERRYRATRR